MHDCRRFYLSLSLLVGWSVGNKNLCEDLAESFSKGQTWPKLKLPRFRRTFAFGERNKKVDTELADVCVLRVPF